MSIYSTCPACGDEFTLPEELLGKKVRCAACGAGVVVNVRAGEPEISAALRAPPEESVAGSTVAAPPGGGDFVPRKRPPIEPEREPWSRLALSLTSVGVASLLALLVLAAGRFWWSWHPNPPAAPGRPVPLRARDPDEIPPEALRVPPRPPPEEGKVAWVAVADPLPQSVMMPVNAGGAIPIPSGHDVLFPHTPSPLALVYPVAAGEGSCQTWDLRTMTPVAKFAKNRPFGQVWALSPEGRHFIAPAPEDFTLFSVFSLGGAGKTWGTGDGAQFIDFAGPGRVVRADWSPWGRIQVWDFATGKLVNEQPAFAGRIGAAVLSPGRRYLAAITTEPDRLTIYDLDRAVKAGEVELPRDKESYLYRCDAVAFSRDGGELAALFRANSGSRLIVWTVASGNVCVHHRFPSDLSELAAPGGKYPGQSLDWLPDGKGWLVYDTLLIDRTGYLLWRVGEASRAAGAGPNRVLDAAHVAVVSGRGIDREIRVMRVPQDQVRAVRQAAEADGRSQRLPPPRLADWLTVRTPPAPASVAWRVEADPAPAYPSPFPRHAVRLGVSGVERGCVLFSSPAVGRAAVIGAAASNLLAPLKRVQVERVHLNAGRHDGGKLLFTTAANLDDLRADFDPDGRTVLIREPAEGRRLDVWSVDGNHVVGWVPYEKESAAANAVAWCAFLDRQRVLTASAGGEVTLWELPQCRAVYATGPCVGGWSLSPAKKYFAAWGGSGIDLFRAGDGEFRGRLTLPAGLQAQRCLASAFRPDGEELAALLRTPAGRVELARWDLKKGSSLGHFSLPDATPELQWCGSGFVLQGEVLIDLERRRRVCRYLLPGPGKHAQSSPDGRHWFACTPGPDQPTVLTAQTLPGAGVRNLPDKSVLTGDK